MNKVVQLALLQMPIILLLYASLDHVILFFVIIIYMYDVFKFFAVTCHTFVRSRISVHLLALCLASVQEYGG